MKLGLEHGDALGLGRELGRSQASGSGQERERADHVGQGGDAGWEGISLPTTTRKRGSLLLNKRRGAATPQESSGNNHGASNPSLPIALKLDPVPHAARHCAVALHVAEGKQ